MSDKVLQELTTDNFIPISSSDKSRLYQPWQYSIIVKVYGRKVDHLSLKQKLQTMWKPTESLSLIDLGNEFFLIKYQKEENMNKALHNGPWFILNHFLSVRWEPKFLASTTKLTYTAIWTRLPELPTEFYDLEILQKVGNKIGKLLKIDTCNTRQLLVAGMQEFA